MEYNYVRISDFWDVIKSIEDNEINNKLLTASANLLNKHHVIMDVDNKKQLVEDMHKLLIFVSSCYVEMFDRWLQTGIIRWNDEPD